MNISLLINSVGIFIFIKKILYSAELSIKKRFCYLGVEAEHFQQLLAVFNVLTKCIYITGQSHAKLCLRECGKCTYLDSNCALAKSHPGICLPLTHSIVILFADSEGPDLTARMPSLSAYAWEYLM